MAQVLDTSSPATATSDTPGGGEKEREEEGERQGGRRKKEREEGRENRAFHNYSLTDERVTSFRFRVLEEYSANPAQPQDSIHKNTCQITAKILTKKIQIGVMSARWWTKKPQAPIPP